ncbi:MAG: helix-turn-helix transcriptional regulator [Candidatus Paceibacterota bacterium]|jgi:transcriptional regulator with XRE-family HTH domain
MKNRLLELRKEKGVKQSKIATAIKVKSTAYSNYETGRREPNIEILIRIADYFGVTVDYLVGRSDSRNGIPQQVLSKMREDIIKGLIGIVEGEIK